MYAYGSRKRGRKIYSDGRITNQKKSERFCNKTSTLFGNFNRLTRWNSERLLYKSLDIFACAGRVSLYCYAHSTFKKRVWNGNDDIKRNFVLEKETKTKNVRRHPWMEINRNVGMNRIAMGKYSKICWGDYKTWSQNRENVTYMYRFQKERFKALENLKKISENKKK